MQPDRPMMEVQTERGPEMREVDHIEVSESWMGSRPVRHVEAIHPRLYDGEQEFQCIDGTVYVIKGLP